MAAKHTPVTLDDSPLPLQILDSQGRVIAVNDSWKALTGYTNIEVEGAYYEKFVPAEWVPDFQRSLQTLLTAGHLDGTRCHIKCKDGATLEVLLFARLKEADGERETHCILLDTTTSQKAERKLAESESRFRSIFELSPTPMVIHDGHEVVLANKAASTFLAYENVDALIGTHISQLVHADSQPGIAERVKRMMSEDWTAPLTEETFLRADGTPVYGETVASPLMVGDRRLIHVVALDVSERRRTRAALAESEERFRCLFESSADAIVVHDGEKALLANNAALEYFHLPADTSVEGLSITDFIHADSLNLITGRIAALMAGHSSHTPVEIKLLRTDAKVWIAEAVSSLITIDGNRMIQSTFRDLTERKRTDRELALYRDELEHLVEERTNSLSQARANLAAVTAVVSHTVEMRDPYTAGHQRRVAELCMAIAGAMEMDEERANALNVAAQMHDVGKVLIPGEILSRPAKLVPIEFELVKSHAQAGFDIVASADLRDSIAEIVYQHHERMDGSGYPRGLTAESLLPESRVLMVADVFEAMASHRPFRPALGMEPAIEELLDGQGTRYDTEVVDYCVSIALSGFEFNEQ
ncbi:MAG: PAS domain S-box protein [Actinomycetota bacterium]|jgi:PAS domain S-box-containing protein|nr:PAS domain S-box protein [Actinomycetota bacterium]